MIRWYVVLRKPIIALIQFAIFQQTETVKLNAKKMAKAAWDVEGDSQRQEKTYYQ